MSVAVLSLRVIIASIAVRSLTTPVKFGGSKIGLPSDQIVESSATSRCSSVSTTFSESTCRNASQSTNVLIALATNSMRSELRCATKAFLPFAFGTRILNATSPGNCAKRALISSARSAPFFAETDAVGTAASVPAAAADFRQCLLVGIILTSKVDMQLGSLSCVEQHN